MKGKKYHDPVWGFGNPVAYMLMYDEQGQPIIKIDKGAEEIDLAKEMLERYSQATNSVEYYEKELSRIEEELMKNREHKSLLEKAMALEGKGELKKIIREER